MGIDLILRDVRDEEADGVELDRAFVHGLLDADGEVGSRLPTDLRARLEPDWGDYAHEWTARDPHALRMDLEALRAFVPSHEAGPDSFGARMTARFVESLDLAISACERAERAGRPVFWAAG